jgi:hypothetical protein
MTNAIPDSIRPTNKGVNGIQEGGYKKGDTRRGIQEGGYKKGNARRPNGTGELS